eukprot:g1001.t1
MGPCWDARRRRTLRLIFISCLYAPAVHAEIFEGDVFSTNSFLPIARFAFAETSLSVRETPNSGTPCDDVDMACIEYEVDFPKGAALRLVMYDNLGSWARELLPGGHLSPSCATRLEGEGRLRPFVFDLSTDQSHRQAGINVVSALAETVFGRGGNGTAAGADSLSPHVRMSYLEAGSSLGSTLDEGVEVLRATGSSPYLTRQTRWFFVALAHCLPRHECERRAAAAGSSSSSSLGSASALGALAAAQSPGTSEYCQGPIRARYRIKMSNGDSSDIFRHFPMNERGLLEIGLGFLLLQTGLVLLSYRVSSILAAPDVNKYHATTRLLHGSVLLQWGALLCFAASTGAFAKAGRRQSSAYVALRWAWLLLHGFAEHAFLLLLILLAKGWALVRSELSSRGKLRITVYMSCYCATYWLSVAWRESLPPFDVVTVYDTTPGALVVALRWTGLAWFLYAAWTTYRNVHRKLRFYRKFTLFCSLWMASLPGTVHVCRAKVDPHYRETATLGAETLFLCITQLVLVLLYHPRLRCSRGFPYHKMTPAQLGIAPQTSFSGMTTHLRLGRASGPVSTTSSAGAGAGAGAGAVAGNRAQLHDEAALNAARRSTATMHAQLELVRAGCDWFSEQYDDEGWGENDNEEDINYDGTRGTSARVRTGGARSSSSSSGGGGGGGGGHVLRRRRGSERAASGRERAAYGRGAGGGALPASVSSDTVLRSRDQLVVSDRARELMNGRRSSKSGRTAAPAFNASGVEVRSGPGSERGTGHIGHRAMRYGDHR